MRVLVSAPDKRGTFLLDSGQTPNIPPRRPLSQKVSYKKRKKSENCSGFHGRPTLNATNLFAEHHVNVELGIFRWFKRRACRRKRFERNDVEKRFLGNALRFRLPQPRTSRNVYCGSRDLHERWSVQFERRPRTRWHGERRKEKIITKRGCNRFTANRYAS